MGDDAKEIKAMQLQSYLAKLAQIRSFALPIRCQHCGDWLVAPVASEFVEGGEIRHTYECDNCGEASTTAISLTTH
jgi:predicted RNA-binding Zn-ribbon protein involved in translation (DUF1610 family)